MSDSHLFTSKRHWKCEYKADWQTLESIKEDNELVHFEMISSQSLLLQHGKHSAATWALRSSTLTPCFSTFHVVISQLHSLPNADVPYFLSITACSSQQTKAQLFSLERCILETEFPLTICTILFTYTITITVQCKAARWEENINYFIYCKTVCTDEKQLATAVNM